MLAREGETGGSRRRGRRLRINASQDEQVAKATRVRTAAVQTWQTALGPSGHEMRPASPRDSLETLVKTTAKRGNAAAPGCCCQGRRNCPPRTAAPGRTEATSMLSPRAPRKDGGDAATVKPKKVRSSLAIRGARGDADGEEVGEAARRAEPRELARGARRSR
jgi:hypothetical protein